MKKLIRGIVGENGRFMKYIVMYCLLFSSAMLLLCYIASWFGIENETLLTTTAAIFGTNLISTLIIKITETKKKQTKEKPAEKAEERKED